MPPDPSSLPAIDPLWDYADPAASEARFRELLPQARAAGDAGYLAELLSQVARAQGLQRRFSEAHATVDAAETMLTDGTPTARVRCLLERGRIFNSAGERAQARPLFVEAWDQARAIPAESHAVDAAHMLGIIEPPEQAVEWNHRAMEYAEQASCPGARKWLGALYNNLGWTWFDRGDYPAAMDLFEKALAWYTEQDRPREIRIARWTVARGLRALGRVSEALAAQEALRAEMEPEGGPDGYVWEELGECLLSLGRADAARPAFARAHALLSQDAWLAENEASRLERLRELAGGA